MENKKALAATRHGMSRTRPYGIWNSMRRRCNNPDARLARWYSGITYDSAWDKFENFWADMQDGYADNLTLDRIDSSKDYSKENCRWVDMKAQARNRRNNVWIPYEGEMLCVTDVANKVGISRSLLYKRLENNCPLERLFEPSRKRNLRSAI